MNKNYDNNNIFAKIIRKEIPSIKVYEDYNTIVIMDSMPQSVGHTLVIPKCESRNILDVNQKNLIKVICIVQKISKVLKNVFCADGITIMQFNEKSGGQTIDHLHFHVIPRFKNIPLLIHTKDPSSKEDLEKSAEKIRFYLEKFEGI